jgi:hypothetical protein
MDEPNETDEPNATENQPASAGDAAKVCGELQTVRQQHADRIQKATAAMNENLNKASQDLAVAQSQAQTKFLQDQDSNAFQQAIGQATRDYWAAMNTANKAAGEELFSAHSDYYQNVQKLLSAVDPKGSTPWSVWLLTQDLNWAASLAATASQQVAACATQ